MQSYYAVVASDVTLSLCAVSTEVSTATCVCRGELRDICNEV